MRPRIRLNVVNEKYQMKNDYFHFHFCKIETRPNVTFIFPISERIELEQRYCAQMKVLFESFQKVYYFFFLFFVPLKVFFMDYINASFFNSRCSAEQANE